MASHLIGQNQITTFVTPVAGAAPIDANTVRGNDNTIKTAYDAHDNDPTIHVQDSLNASRPAAGTAGRKWLDSDTFRVYYDDGAAWNELAYLVTGGAGSVTSLTYTLSVKSTTAFATPSALAATQASLFASTVSGATLMGYGTTGDVSLKNRAGTTVAYVGPNNLSFYIPGTLVLGSTLAGGAGTVQWYSDTVLSWKIYNLTGDGKFYITDAVNANVALEFGPDAVAPTAKFYGNVLFNAAATRLVPGATSFSLRNNANSADNFIVLDAGSATLRAGLAIGGALSGVTTLAASSNAVFGAASVTNPTAWGRIVQSVSASSAAFSMLDTSATAQQWSIAVNSKNFVLFDDTAVLTCLTVTKATGAAAFASSITTGAPSGGAGAWKLGIANAVSPTSPNRTVTIDIGGTTYYVAAKTTND